MAQLIVVLYSLCFKSSQSLFEIVSEHVGEDRIQYDKYEENYSLGTLESLEQLFSVIFLLLCIAKEHNNQRATDDHDYSRHVIFPDPALPEQPDGQK